MADPPQIALHVEFISKLVPTQGWPLNLSPSLIKYVVSRVRWILSVVGKEAAVDVDSLARQAEDLDGVVRRGSTCR